MKEKIKELSLFLKKNGFEREYDYLKKISMDIERVIDLVNHRDPDVSSQGFQLLSILSENISFLNYNINTIFPDIIGLSFKNINANNSSLQYIEDCIFENCMFQNIKVRFNNPKILNSSFINCDFSNSNFQKASFENCKFINCNFSNCIMSSIDNVNTIYESCDFTGLLYNFDFPQDVENLPEKFSIKSNPNNLQEMFDPNNFSKENIQLMETFADNNFEKNKAINSIKFNKGIFTRIQVLFQRLGVNTVDELCRLPKKEIIDTRLAGRKTIELINSVFAYHDIECPVIKNYFKLGS